MGMERFPDPVQRLYEIFLAIFAIEVLILFVLVLR